MPRGASTAATTGTPPSAPGNPLLGNLLQARRDPLKFFLGSAGRHGDVVRYRVLTEVGYLVSHPEGVEHVLQKNHRNYDKGTEDYDVLRWLLGQGLLTSDGDFWRRQRRLMQPAFHRRLVATFGERMVGETATMLERWRPHAESGQPVDVAAEMMRLTLDIVGHALFGLDLSREATSFGRAFTEANRYLSDRLYFPFPPPSVPTPRNRRFKAALRTLDAVAEGVIRERRRAADGEDRGDLLSMLLSARDEETGEGMDDRQLRDEVMTLLLAGHETTANALSWTWYLLGEHPEAEERLRAELSGVLGVRLPTVEDVPNLRYTRMVIEESMRLYPPVWAIGRNTIAEDEILGYRIPANVEVTLSAYVTHRHPAFWEDPEVFDPERFSPGRSEGRPRFAYFPFAGGPRLCIGRDFALLEAQLILATVAQRYRPRLVPGHPVESEPLITLRPRRGLPMTLHPE